MYAISISICILLLFCCSVFQSFFFVLLILFILYFHAVIGLSWSEAPHHTSSRENSISGRIRNEILSIRTTVPHITSGLPRCPSCCRLLQANGMSPIANPQSYCAICIAWRVFGEWRQGVRRALQRRGEEAKEARRHHQQTGEHLEVPPTGPSHDHSQLWDFTSQLQLSASEHGQGQRDLYALIWPCSKSLVLNTIRRLKIQCEDMKQSRHYSTSSSIAIPGRDSECSGNYYSGSSFGMSSGSMGSYYHVHPLSCFLCSARHEIRLVPLFTLIVVATQIYRETIIRFLMNGRVFPLPSSTIWALSVWRKPKYWSL